jgi:two-component system cell cycle response regulator DivK
MQNAMLIIDDNPQNLKLARVLFTSKGYDVRTAEDAEQALLLLESFHPAVILMDLQLPGMDGLELTRKLKSDPRTSRIVIIALTAYAMKGDAARAYEAGCDGYAAKPIDVKTLPDLVARVVAGTRASTDN